MDSFLQNNLSDLAIEHSWRRSVDYGLNAGRRVDLRCLTPGQLNSRQQQHSQVLAHLHNYFGLFERLQGGKQSRLIFADRAGSILYSSGCRQFGSKASRLMLEPGVGWEEQSMGTNAIGTALAQQADIQVLGRQHFMLANHGISCSASPVFDPQGQLLGVLDISSEAGEHNQNMLFSARLLALCVENALIAEQNEAHWLLSLAADGIHMQQPWSGLVALNEAGQITGANRIARQLLPGLQAEQLLQELVPGQMTRRGEGAVLLTRNLVSAPTPRTTVTETKQAAVDSRALALLNAGISLLVQGETGVGKDHLVRQLHEQSNRRDGPLVAVNCGALPAELIEAELFGYQAGAFTGSDRNGRLGYVRAADKGILFLDEIGELPLVAQTRLLRVLQDKNVTPVGSHVPEMVDFHVVAATNQDLAQLVAAGRFREDLFFRLNGYQVQLPSLKEYEYEAFCTLARQIMAALAGEGGRAAAVLQEALLQQLFASDWPGNIRQLKQALEVALVLADGKPLRLEHFPGLGQVQPEHPAVSVKAKSLQHAKQVLEQQGGNISAAARELGISRTTLYSWLKS